MSLDEKEFTAAMDYIVEALQEKGYDPYAQLIGYVEMNTPIYITGHKGARKLIETLDFEQVTAYVRNMKQ